MHDIPSNWEQPVQPSGLPWQLILIPLELALVLVSIWWFYTTTLTPRPVQQRLCKEDDRRALLRGGLSGTPHLKLEVQRDVTVIRDTLNEREVAKIKTGVEWTAAVYHPPSNILAVGTDTGGLKLFDVSSDRSLGTMPGHGGRVRELLFSPDGNLLASAGDDGVIRLWEVTQRKLKHELTDFEKKRSLWPYKFRFSARGQFLCATVAHTQDGGPGELYWDTTTGQRLHGPNVPHRFVNFAPGTDEVLYRKPLVDQRERHQFLDDTLQLWDLRRNQNTGAWKLPDLGGKLRDQTDVEVSPDGTKLAYLIRSEAHEADDAKSRSKMVVVDRATGQAILVFPGEEEPHFVSNTLLLAIGPDTDLIADRNDQRFRHVWDLTNLGTSPTLAGQAVCAVIACGLVAVVNLGWRLRRRPSIPTVKLAE